VPRFESRALGAVRVVGPPERDARHVWLVRRGAPAVAAVNPETGAERVALRADGLALERVAAAPARDRVFALGARAGVAEVAVFDWDAETAAWRAGAGPFALPCMPLRVGCSWPAPGDPSSTGLFLYGTGEHMCSTAIELCSDGRLVPVTREAGDAQRAAHGALVLSRGLQHFAHVGGRRAASVDYASGALACGGHVWLGVQNSHREALVAVAPARDGAHLCVLTHTRSLRAPLCDPQCSAVVRDCDGGRVAFVSRNRITVLRAAAGD
jgi:hypothetical protein